MNLTQNEINSFILVNRSMLHGGGTRTWQENKAFEDGYEHCLQNLEKFLKEKEELYKAMEDIFKNMEANHEPD